MYRLRGVLSELRPWLGRNGLLLKISTFLIITVPPYYALLAVTGGPADRGSGGFMIGVGAIVGQRYRWQRFWALPDARRQAVAGAITSGISTGDPDLDHLARAMLADRGKGWPAPAVLLAVLIGGPLAITIVAAVRENPAWLLAGVPMCVVLKDLPQLFRDPRPALRAMTEGTSH